MKHKIKNIYIPNIRFYNPFSARFPVFTSGQKIIAYTPTLCQRSRSFVLLCNLKLDAHNFVTLCNHSNRSLWAHRVDLNFLPFSTITSIITSTAKRDLMGSFLDYPVIGFFFLSLSLSFNFKIKETKVNWPTYGIRSVFQPSDFMALQCRVNNGPKV